MPLIEEILRRDKDGGMLQIDFAVPGGTRCSWVVRDRVGTPAHNAYPQSPAFKEENGGCFFAWYTAAITGNGDIRPCCLLLNPNVKPLGNIHDGQHVPAALDRPRVHEDARRDARSAADEGQGAVHAASASRSSSRRASPKASAG